MDSIRRDKLRLPAGSRTKQTQVPRRSGCTACRFFSSFRWLVVVGFVSGRWQPTMENSEWILTWTVDLGPWNKAGPGTKGRKEVRRRGLMMNDGG